MHEENRSSINIAREGKYSREVKKKKTFSIFTIINQTLFNEYSVKAYTSVYIK